MASANKALILYSSHACVQIDDNRPIDYVQHLFLDMLVKLGCTNTVYCAKDDSLLTSVLGLNEDCSDNQIDLKTRHPASLFPEISQDMQLCVFTSSVPLYDSICNSTNTTSYHCQSVLLDINHNLSYIEIISNAMDRVLLYLKNASPGVVALLDLNCNNLSDSDFNQIMNEINAIEYCCERFLEWTKSLSDSERRNDEVHTNATIIFSVLLGGLQQSNSIKDTTTLDKFSIVPIQSFRCAENQNQVSRICTGIFTQYHPKLTRNDECDHFSVDHCKIYGGNCSTDVSHILPELAFLIGYMNKYGS